MVRVFSIMVLLTLVVVACTRKVAPDSGASGTKQTETTKKDGEEVPQKTEEPVYDPDSEKGKPPTSEPPVTPPNVPPPSAPKAPEKGSEVDLGKSVYASKCNKCHAAKNVSRYTLVQWETILKVMVPNAKLTAEEESYLYAYIKANAK